MTQREAAKKYHIPRSTLKNKGAHVNKIGGQVTFSKEEEASFTRHCTLMCDFGFPVDLLDLRFIVKSYLDRTGRKVMAFSNNLPGKEWARSFLNRNNDLTVRLSANIKRKRAEISETKL